MTGMNAKPASVPSLVSYVSTFVLTRIICTAWKMGKFISAGEFHELTCTLPNHGRRQEHLCTSGCSAQGICEIETAPQSIEATFTGKHETFQYTKVWDYHLHMFSRWLISFPQYSQGRCAKLPL